MKPKVALVRGKFLNHYEMQSYEPLIDRYSLTAFGSLRPFHDRFAFPVVKLWSPMDLPNFPYKMPILNRLTSDAQYLLGLEQRLTGYDIAHTAETYYHYTAQALYAKRKAKVKAVVTTVLETIPHNNEGIWGRATMKANARENVDHFIAISKRAKDALITEGTDPKKITVIPYGIDTKRFTDKKVKKDESALNILFVGRLEKEKGVGDLLEAFIRVAKQTPDMTLTLVGSGSERSRLLERVKEVGLEGRVTFTISTYADMPRVYERADIFVAPSSAIKTWEEQYNIALLEAQAAGLPIITTNSGAIPENVGDAALVISSHDIDELTQALETVCTNAAFRRTLGAKARKRAESVHDISIVSRRIDALYKEVLTNVKAKTR